MARITLFILLAVLWIVHAQTDLGALGLAPPVLVADIVAAAEGTVKPCRADFLAALGSHETAVCARIPYRPLQPHEPVIDDIIGRYDRPPAYASEWDSEGGTSSKYLAWEGPLGQKVFGFVIVMYGVSAFSSELDIVWGWYDD